MEEAVNEGVLGVLAVCALFKAIVYTAVKLGIWAPGATEVSSTIPNITHRGS